ncbi:glycosyl transferase family 2 [Chthoniobacter flavus Ellin428]|uniref:Glycosyl transferase family 2 n=1 Tax=Chthoniobacter flavus Ellin428 TaxID=497964 RepID=B4D9F0_9BACT|nr:glycosyltransferase [Chthoniobacter flavus]EDY16911.1 glycosyl transferase family 2 [Chthoniobacter flavus Ellin428]TCO87792.1 glycosyl transferase family 2 [Chthoniobacter flavus]
MEPISTRKLTISILTFDDFDGLYFTIQAIRLFHPEVAEEIEFLVMDNHPSSAHGAAVARFTKWIAGQPVRYVPVTDGVGSVLKYRAFDLAATPYVLGLDSHVLLAPGALRKLIDFFEAGRDGGNLLQGPLQYDDLRHQSTHFDPVWRSQMLGIWASAWRCGCGGMFSTRREETPPPHGTLACHSLKTGERITRCQCERVLPSIAWCGHEKHLEAAGFAPALTSEGPFEIPAQGMGVFACRRDAWVGFNPRFSGFGGEECYIHEKFRQAGKSTLCLPFLRWVHRFERPAGVPYRLQTEDRVRNYLIGHAELRLDPAPVLEHFANALPRERLDVLQKEAAPSPEEGAVAVASSTLPFWIGSEIAGPAAGVVG